LLTSAACFATEVDSDRSGAAAPGSVSCIDFANFLNTARRSTFEVANILFLLSRNRYTSEPDLNKMIGELEEESRMIFAFMRTLRSKSKG
jgi:four helix bundle protein